MSDELWVQVVIILLDKVEAMAWPLLVLFLALWFSSDLKSLISKIKRLSSNGIELHAQPVSATAEKKSTAEISNSENVELIDPVAKRIEEANRKELDERCSNDPQKREFLLFRSLTVQQMEKNFALAYANIFGSQIRALKELNSSPIPRGDAETMFNELKTQHSVFQNWKLTQYLNYLFDWDLINETNQVIEITETGRNFLRFIVDNRLPENRPY